VPSCRDSHEYGKFHGVGWFRTTFTLDAAAAALPIFGHGQKGAIGFLVVDP
jgi:hypothetical protein